MLGRNTIEKDRQAQKGREGEKEKTLRSCAREETETVIDSYYYSSVL